MKTRYTFQKNVNQNIRNMETSIAYQQNYDMSAAASLYLAHIDSHYGINPGERFGPVRMAEKAVKKLKETVRGAKATINDFWNITVSKRDYELAVPRSKGLYDNDLPLEEAFRGFGEGRHNLMTPLEVSLANPFSVTWGGLPTRLEKGDAIRINAVEVENGKVSLKVNVKSFGPREGEYTFDLSDISRRDVLSVADRISMKRDAVALSTALQWKPEMRNEVFRQWKEDTIKSSFYGNSRDFDAWFGETIGIESGSNILDHPQALERLEVASLRRVEKGGLGCDAVRKLSAYATAYTLREGAKRNAALKNEIDKSLIIKTGPVGTGSLSEPLVSNLFKNDYEEKANPISNNINRNRFTPVAVKVASDSVSGRYNSPVSVVGVLEIEKDGKKFRDNITVNAQMLPVEMQNEIRRGLVKTFHLEKEQKTGLRR